MKSIILNDTEATSAARLKIGETITLVRPLYCKCNEPETCHARNLQPKIMLDCEYDKSKKYHPGDILAVKERWYRGRLSGEIIHDLYGVESARSMPIEHARTWLRVQDVRVEKVTVMWNDRDSFNCSQGFLHEKPKRDSFIVIPECKVEIEILEWNHRYPKHKWNPDLLVCVITAEKIKKPKGA